MSKSVIHAHASITTIAGNACSDTPIARNELAVQAGVMRATQH
jgi:hypothetical protein